MAMKNSGKVLCSPQKPYVGFIIFLFCCSLFAQTEVRTWTSTSGSTIEATFLGAYGEDFWFEAADDSRFLKMPAKYISAPDVELVESAEITGALPSDISDNDAASVALWENMYTTGAVAFPEGITDLAEALEALIEPRQPVLEEGSETTRIETKFKKRRDRKTPLPENIEPGTIYQVMQQLLEPNELRLQILEGNILVVRTS